MILLNFADCFKICLGNLKFCDILLYMQHIKEGYRLVITKKTTFKSFHMEKMSLILFKVTFNFVTFLR